MDLTLDFTRVKSEPGTQSADVPAAYSFPRMMKKTRTNINLAMKLDIIKYAEENPHIKQAAIARLYGIDRTAVTKILKKKNEFLCHNMNMKHLSQAPCKTSSLRLLEDTLYKWLKMCKIHDPNGKFMVEDSTIKGRSARIAAMMGYASFNPTDTWLYLFKKRYSLPRAIQAHIGNEFIEPLQAIDTSPECSTNDSWSSAMGTEGKVVQARRDRSDRLSKLMGDYLLRGWKMLASYCDTCGNILFEDKQSQKYCISCNELDSDVDKDDPAISDMAAESQTREEQRVSGASSSGTHHRDIPDLTDSAVIPLRPQNAANDCDANLLMDLLPAEYSNRLASLTSQSASVSQSIDQSAYQIPLTTSQIFRKKMNPSQSRSVTSSAVFAPRNVLGSQATGSQSPTILGSRQSPAQPDIVGSLAVNVANTIDGLAQKMCWATEELRTSQNIEQCTQLCCLIKSAAEAMVAVKAVNLTE